MKLTRSSGYALVAVGHVARNHSGELVLARDIAKQHKIRPSASALFFNNKKELLLVKPSYKNHLILPGGAIEKGESPLEACKREIKEEIGISNIDYKFLGVKYLKVKKYDNDESLQFFFHGGIIKKNQIKIDSHEIEDFKFIPINNANKYHKRTGMKLEDVLAKLLKNGSCYLEEYQ